MKEADMWAELDRAIEGAMVGARKEKTGRDKAVAEVGKMLAADVEELATAYRLSPAQIMTCILLSGGSLISVAAKSCQVARTSVSEWFLHHLGYRQLYYVLVQEQIGELQMRTLQLGCLAIAALETFVKSPWGNPGTAFGLRS